MDIYNFGGYKSSEILVEQLAKFDKYKQRKISRLFNNYALGIKNIGDIEDHRIRERLWTFWRDEYLIEVDKMAGVSDDIKRSIRCIIVSFYRDALRDTNEYYRSKGKGKWVKQS